VSDSSVADSSVSGGPPPDQGPLSPAGVKALKIAIVAMGIMIIVGVAVVIGRMIYLASSSPSPVRAHASTRTVPARFADKIAVALPVGASARQISLNGSSLAILYQGGTGRGIIVIDLASGKEISRIDFSAAQKTRAGVSPQSK